MYDFIILQKRVRNGKMLISIATVCVLAFFAPSFEKSHIYFFYITLFTSLILIFFLIFKFKKTQKSFLFTVLTLSLLILLLLLYTNYSFYFFKPAHTYFSLITSRFFIFLQKTKFTFFFLLFAVILLLLIFYEYKDCKNNSCEKPKNNK